MINFKEETIIEYILLKIRTGINNEFFNYTIKNNYDYLLLNDILDKTSKSFYGLEKAFAQFIEEGKTYFYIDQDKVRWVRSEQDSNHSIHCMHTLYDGNSYLRFYNFLENDVLLLNNLLKYISEIESKIFSDHMKSILNMFKSNADLLIKQNIEKLNDKKYLDIVYDSFKEEMTKLFFKAVTIKSNGLLSEEGLKNRVLVSMLTFSPEEVKDGYEEKLEKSRLNFLEILKDKLKDIDLDKFDDQDFVHEGY